MLADRHLHSDPPAADELDAVRRELASTFLGLGAPAVEGAAAVGGTATSLLRVLGAALDHETLERGVEMLREAPVAELARRLELDPERVRVLPAGILVLQALSDRLGPLQVACGGLREGALLELAERRATGHETDTFS